MAEDEDSDIEILPAQGTVAFLNYRPSRVVFGSGTFFWARRISGTGIRYFFFFLLTALGPTSFTIMTKVITLSQHFFF